LRTCWAPPRPPGSCSPWPWWPCGRAAGRSIPSSPSASLPGRLGKEAGPGAARTAAKQADRMGVTCCWRSAAVPVPVARRSGAIDRRGIRALLPRPATITLHLPGEAEERPDDHDHAEYRDAGERRLSGDRLDNVARHQQLQAQQDNLAQLLAKRAINIGLTPD